MDVLEAIRSRRMLPKVGEEPPTAERIAELLDLAVRAPNHHLTEPWRFYVLRGAERDRLARAMADEAVARGVRRADAETDAARKVGRAPVIVVFTSVPGEGDDVVEQEEIASVAMAIQNFLLAAHASGLGAMLRTGPVAYHGSIGAQLGLAPGERVVGFVYVGHPTGERALTPRKSAAEQTTWLGWDE
ncbi:MAG: nitroreductase family protein [Actinomycetota bacterium]